MTPSMNDDDDTILRKFAALAAAEVAAHAKEAAEIVVRTAAHAAAMLSETTRVDLLHIKGDLAEIKMRLDSRYVSLDVFEPIKKLVYGMVALVLTAVVVALLTLIIRAN